MSTKYAENIELLPKKPRPLPDSLPPVMQLDPKLLPELIRGYVEDITERQQCPIDFVAISAICGLAGVLGNKAKIKPKQQDDWIVIPNLWGALIGRPSMMKTPAMKAALEPIRKIEDDLLLEYKDSTNNYGIEKELNELSKAYARSKARNAIERNSPVQAKEFLQATNFDDLEPKRKRIIVNDSTVEKIGELLNENPNGLLMVRDELTGLLGKLKKEDHQKDRSFYLESYNGDSYRYDRIGRGTIDIQSTTLSILGGIQPNRIASLVRDTISGGGDDGLLQRFQLAVWPDDNTKWAWVDRAPNEKAKIAYINAFNHFHRLGFESFQGSCFRFTLTGQDLFKEWMTKIQGIARAEDTHPAFQSYLLKLPKTVSSLALIFHLLRYSSGAIPSCVDEEEIARAQEYTEYLISHAERLYSIAANQGLDGARLLLKRLDKLDNPFTARDVLRKGWAGLCDIDVINEALSWLVDYHHITDFETPPNVHGGRPTIYYSINKV